MGKGKSGEVQRIIRKSKSKVGVSGRELDTMKFETHPGCGLCILSFSHESASCYRTTMHNICKSSFWVILECLPFFNLVNSYSAL